MPRKGMRPKVIFNDIAYYQNKKGYYVCSDSLGGKQLHRVIWEYAFGEIPEKFHIHHIDGNPSNNSIHNLACVSPKAHKLFHKGEYPPEMRKRMSELRKQEWVRKPAREIVCGNCATVFSSTGQRAAFCCKKCYDTWRRSPDRKRLQPSG